VEEDPSLLESLHRPLRSADELIGEAGRLWEPIPDGAGNDNLLRSAQVDQVTDTGLIPSCEGDAADTARLDGMSHI
jgi:hypothetical protein